MIYDLQPQNGRKSFYGKAKVEVLEDGTKILESYGTKILMITPKNKIFRLWDGWTTTTGTHIKSFCGLNKKEFLELELKKI